MENNFHIKETSLIEADQLREGYGLLHTFIKDESKNPFGTVKDRRNAYIIQEANRLKVDKLVLITSGNNGYSLAQFAKNTPIKTVCIVSRDLSKDIKDILRQTAYQVIELNLDHKILRPEELVAFAREQEDEVIWEVTNGYEENYVPIVKEIFEKVVPDYIVVPVGSGGIFIGLMQGLEQRHAKTKIVGVGAQNTIHSFADKLSTPWTPYAKAIQNYQKQGHFLYRLSEDEVRDTYRKFKNIVDCEPSSSVVFAAIKKHGFKPDDKIVFLNSGRAVF